MPAIYHEGSWLGNATDPEVLVKDTVGWTGKNRAYSQTNNTVIAHIENGITYDVSWTGSATVTLKKNSASGATITSGSTSPLSFTADADYELYFGSSATVTNIMVKDSRITDPTYEPYHESVEDVVEQVYVDNGVLGAKNLLPFPYKDRAGTNNGVTYVYNSDNTITANGEATSVSWRTLLEDFSSLKLNERYILSGCPSGGSSSTYRIFVTYNDGTEKFYNDYGNGVEFTNTGNLVRIQVRIEKKYTANNLTFKPMIRLASDPDDTYQPYVMTNRELTEKVFEKRILTSSDNLNDIKETGVYGISTAPVNSPNNLSYSTLIVQANDANNLRQIIYSSGNDWGSIYVRSFRGNPAAWTPWYKFTGTVVS